MYDWSKDMKNRLIILFAFVSLQGTAQLNNDSLKQVIVTAPNDTNKIVALHTLSDNIYRKNPEEANGYTMQGIAIAQQIGTKGYEGKMELQLAKQYTSTARFDSAFFHYQCSIDLLESAGDNKLLSLAKNLMGLAYSRIGENDKAVEIINQGKEIAVRYGYRKSVIQSNERLAQIEYNRTNLLQSTNYYLDIIKEFKALNDSTGLARAYANFGQVKMGMGKNYAALILFHNALSMFGEEASARIKVAIHNNMGGAYLALEQLDSAQNEYQVAVDICLESGRERELGVLYHNLGAVQKDLHFYDSAEVYFMKAVEIRTQFQDKAGLSSTYAKLASISEKRGEYSQAIKYGEISMQLGEEVNSLSFQKAAAKALYNSYKALQNDKQALKFIEIQFMLSDSILGNGKKEEIMTKQFEHDFYMRTMADSLENAKDKALADEKHKSDMQKAESNKKRQNTIIMAVSAGLLLLVIFSVFIFNRFRVTRKQKGIIEDQKAMVDDAYDELEEKNSEILDSITYAKRIQEAILPPTRLVKEWLPNSFVLYKPKDIVAGDFYWMESIDNTIIFAAADCTGHGVPGAMVSVVCHNAMNRAVREFGLREPGQILDKTRELVVRTFEKSEEEVKDGMDIALCSLQGNTLKYAGANNPLWIVRKEKVKSEGESENNLSSLSLQAEGEAFTFTITETKATKQPIGKVDDPKPFTTHTFDLQQGDVFYIFSDGYVDQFGGVNGKKFKAKAFRDLLLSIQSETMEKQRELINEAFENWRGDLEQVDDVCVIGVKF
jgi:serine phosphatase RsbU (regulator of sigma subunit)/tetratricopeptide (TPR) repeat protein